SHPSLSIGPCLLFLTHPPPTPPSTPSLHDALPIFPRRRPPSAPPSARCSSRSHFSPPGPCSARPESGRSGGRRPDGPRRTGSALDRKSTRLNSSHVSISYAVFCLKKKNDTKNSRTA